MSGAPHFAASALYLYLFVSVVGCLPAYVWALAVLGAGKRARRASRVVAAHLYLGVPCGLAAVFATILAFAILGGDAPSEVLGGGRYGSVEGTMVLLAMGAALAWPFAAAVGVAAVEVAVRRQRSGWMVALGLGIGVPGLFAALTLGIGIVAALGCLPAALAAHIRCREDLRFLAQNGREPRSGPVERTPGETGAGHQPKVSAGPWRNVASDRARVPGATR